MTIPVDPLSERGVTGLRLSRRSLIAAGAIVATVGSTSVAKAFANPSKWQQQGFGGGPERPGSAPDHNCFCRGTRLLTATGEIAVEDLSIGDLVVTHGGAERPIRWIGRVSVRRDGGSAWTEGAMPLRIAKDAFAPGVPHRDLYLSREHRLFLNGVLISAGNLINGTTIRAVAPDTDVVHYFHVELDGHDVLLAEGAPCDSLLASAESRMRFDNYDEYVAEYGPAAVATMVPCAPIASYNGGRGELKSRLRSALAPIVDIRHPMDIVRDNLEARARLSKAA